VAVYHDATGHALERAIAYAKAVFGDEARIGTTTVAEEVEADLAAFEARVGGPEAVLAELDAVLVRSAHEPDCAKLAFYQRLRAVVAGRVGRTSSSGGFSPPAPPPTEGLRPSLTLPVSPQAPPSESGTILTGVRLAKMRGVA